MSASKLLGQIYEGWRNKLVPPEDLKAVIAEVSAARAAVCEDCQFHSKFHHSIRLDDHCTLCGCTLSAKTKCLSCKCPLPAPLWDEIEVKIKE